MVAFFNTTTANMSDNNIYCVNPQMLMRQPQRSSTPRPGPVLETNGRIHSHSRAPNSHHGQAYPTPQAILSGTYTFPPQATTSTITHEPTQLEYVPRASKYAAGHIAQSPPPINFSVGGRPGPFLEDILRKKVVLDGANDDVFHGHWRQTKWTFDWPGLHGITNGVYCVDVNNKPLTRDELAREVCANIGMIMQKARKGDQRYMQAPGTPPEWLLQNCHFRDVRIFALHYVHSVWVPVLVIQRS